MKNFSRKVFAFMLTGIWLIPFFHAFSQPLPGKIHFAVSAENPEHHYYHVIMQCKGLQKDSLDFSMPVWSPGYYLIMDYSQHVLNFRASGENGKPLEWKKSDKNTWRVMNRTADSLTVQYDVYAYSVSVAEPYLDVDRGFLSPTGLFLYIEGMIRHPVTLSIKPCHGFKAISTGLDPVHDVPYTFFAPDFDVLYDCPVLLGNQEILTFTVEGIPHFIAIEDPGTIDRERLAGDLKKIVETTASLIGDIPYRHYTFLMMIRGRGGLEHFNSMAVYYDPEGLADENRYKGTLSFFAHEYFHLYNVKTIRPFSLGPFDYEKENDTRLLWISEGITVYYENLILNRAGFFSRDECLGEFSHAIGNYENIPGHLFQSAEESGINAWMQFFNFLYPGKNNTTISYYDKGCALGLLIDLKIRHETEGKKCLDDVMRQLYREFYLTRNRGFTEQEFRRTCENVAGCSLDEIFSYASTVAPIDYPRYFAYAGLEIDTAWHEIPGIFTGFRTHEENNKLIISFVQFNSPAWTAGLNAEDEIIEINEKPADSKGWTGVLDTANPGDTIRLTICHRDIHHNTKVIAGKNRNRAYTITPMNDASAGQYKILEGWLVE